MIRYNFNIGIILAIQLGFCSTGQSQELGYQVALYSNATKLTQIEFTKGILFGDVNIKSQPKPGFQVDVAVIKKSNFFLEPAMRLKFGYASHNTYFPIFYPEDGHNLTTSKYSSISKESSVSFNAIGRFKMKRIFVDLGIGYHSSLSHEINSLIRKGYDNSIEDRPDGESVIIKGTEVNAAVNYLLKENDKSVFVVAGVNYLLAKEKYYDPTSEIIWAGYPISLFLGIGYLW